MRHLSFVLVITYKGVYCCGSIVPVERLQVLHLGRQRKKILLVEVCNYQVLPFPLVSCRKVACFYAVKSCIDKIRQLTSLLFLNWRDQFVSIALPLVYLLHFHVRLFEADCKEGISCNFEISSSSLENGNAIVLGSLCSIYVYHLRRTQDCCPIIRLTSW